MVATFEELIVYQRAYKIALELHKIALDFPKIEQYDLASQIRRASKSICANIAEGFAKHYHSKKEFQRFLAIALGSSNEMIVWIEFTKDLGYVSEDLTLTFKQEYIEIGKMLYSLSKNWKST